MHGYSLKVQSAASTGHRFLRSASHGDLMVLWTRTSSYGQHSFAVSGPVSGCRLINLTYSVKVIASDRTIWRRMCFEGRCSLIWGNAYERDLQGSKARSRNARHSQLYHRHNISAALILWPLLYGPEWTRLTREDSHFTLGDRTSDETREFIPSSSQYLAN